MLEFFVNNIFAFPSQSFQHPVGTETKLHLSCWLKQSNVEPDVTQLSVIFDDEKDPQFSAVTANIRIELFLNYRNITGENRITDFLHAYGYNDEDIALFWKKYKKELPYYHFSKTICSYGKNI